MSSFGSGHGAFSRFKSYYGVRKAISPTDVSAYILERKLVRLVNQCVTPSVMREIAEMYNLNKYYLGEKGSKKIKERIEQVKYKITNMNTAKLQEAFDIFDNKGIIDTLLFINGNRPIITQKHTQVQKTIFDDGYKESE